MKSYLSEGWVDVDVMAVVIELVVMVADIPLVVFVVYFV
jgi:hypothetical protein